MSQEPPGGFPHQPRNETEPGIPADSAAPVTPSPDLQQALAVLKRHFPQTIVLGLPAPGVAAGRAPVLLDWNGDPASLVGWLEWFKSMLLSDLSEAVMGGGAESEQPGTELGSEVPDQDEDLETLSRVAVSSDLAGLELQGLSSKAPPVDPGPRPRAKALTAEEIAALSVTPPEP